jgi:sulfide:quinone oxidoreductase
VGGSARVLILGAGFGGLELATQLSEALGDAVEVTLIDRSDAFVFGFAKLDVMFGRRTLEEVRLPYAAIAKPGVRVLRETITAIDAERRRVTTSQGTHDADVLVIALGADYDLAATPGLAEGGNEFYSVAGAAGLREKIAAFDGGTVVIGVCGTPFKCPPAPSECALMLHDHLVERGVRDRCELTFTIPFQTPVPPSPDTSAAIVEAFAERGISFHPGRRVTAIDPGRKVAVYDDGGELPFDLFLGVPRHRAPDVVIESGMAVDGYIPVASRTLESSVPGVYALGDCATVGVPKAGVFAEGQAATVARALIARFRDGGGGTEGYAGRGSCYIEFGADRIGRVDVDFFGGPKPTGTFQPPSHALRVEKDVFGASRRRRWFGL